jgi:uncharacterized protein YidB (DUF937 family)
MSISSVAQSTDAYPPAPAGGAHRRHPGMPPEAAQAAASALGTSSADVTGALKNGTTLSALAQQKGVSQSDLVSAVTAGLKSGAPAGAPTLSGDQLTTMATNMVNGTRPAGPAGPPPGGPPPAMGGQHGAVSSSGATSDLQRLAQDLGVDPGQLLSQLQSGDTSLLDPLTGATASTNGSTAATVAAYGSSPTQTSGLITDVQA